MKDIFNIIVMNNHNLAHSKTSNGNDLSAKFKNISNEINTKIHKIKTLQETRKVKDLLTLNKMSTTNKLNAIDCVDDFSNRNSDSIDDDESEYNVIMKLKSNNEIEYKTEKDVNNKLIGIIETNFNVKKEAKQKKNNLFCLFCF